MWVRSGTTADCLTTASLVRSSSCENAEWKLTFEKSGERVGTGWREFVPEQAEEALWVRYSVHLDLFNGKEIPVGLRETSIIFVCDGGRLEIKRPHLGFHRTGRGGGATPPKTPRGSDRSAARPPPRAPCTTQQRTPA